ncbi:MAG: GNAT family N-acetyltransferase [Candidatus Thorarchaeota archaeon]|nr:MAG: GNAT family N-acetyltransferase [Candidatus Thorarchaeota archaeon]
MTDLEHVMKYWNTYQSRRFLGSAIPMSETTEKQWLERATTAQPWEQGSMVLVIEDKKSGEFLGTTSLFDISKPFRRAEFGVAIHNPEKHGKGYGTDATNVTLWIAFHVLGLRSVYLYVMAQNKRAIRSYEKAGFKHAGVFRKAMFSDGEYHDLAAMDILCEEFLEECPPGQLIAES